MNQNRTYYPIRPAHRIASGYRTSVPAGTWWSGYLRSCQAASLAEDDWSFAITTTHTFAHLPSVHYSLITDHSSHTFSAKEKDTETGYSYFGARYYSSDLSIWLSVDPMSDKYPSLSPYTYCANNPIRIIDPSGDSCAVLLAGKAVYGAGHMAILIQNKDKQWELYSKNGDDDGDPKTFSGEVRGTPDDQPCVDRETGGVKSWGSVQDFLDDPDYNTVNHDGEGGTYYIEAYVLPTTQNQDDIIRDGMKKKLDEKYNVLTNNCSQAVTYSLRKAGVNLVSRAVGDPMNFSGSRPTYVGKGTIPYVTFEKIRLCNPGNKLYYPKR